MGVSEKVYSRTLQFAVLFEAKCIDNREQLIELAKKYLRGEGVAMNLLRATGLWKMAIEKALLSDIVNISELISWNGRDKRERA